MRDRAGSRHHHFANSVAGLMSPDVQVRCRSDARKAKVDSRDGLKIAADLIESFAAGF